MFRMLYWNVTAVLAKLLGTVSVTVLSVIFLTSVAVQAQTTTTSATDGTTPLGIAPGAPAGSYPLSDIDVINLFNGQLNFRLPLYQVSGRGGANATLMLALNQQRWRVLHHVNVNLQTHEETHSYAPTTARWGGIEPGYGLAVLQGRRSGDGAFISCQGHVAKHYTCTLTRLTFTLQDGTEYELIDQLTGGKPATYASICGPGSSRGTVFNTSDGTSATFISNSVISDAAFTDEYKTFTPSGFVMLRDGTRYRIDQGKVTWMRDRNGNQINVSYPLGQLIITDSLNRKVTVELDVNAGSVYGISDRITYQGFGGAQRIIHTSKTNLGNALGAGYSLQTYQQLFPNSPLNGSGTSQYNPTVTSIVWLPDDRKFRFYYSSYGEVARVELPSGGAIEYGYPSTPGIYSYYNSDTNTDEYGIFRPVTERRVYPNGGSGTSYEVKTTYTGIGTVAVDHLDSTGTLLAREKHYFYGGPTDDLYIGPVDYPAWTSGKEYKTEVIMASDGETVLQEKADTWEQTAPSWWAAWAGCPCPDFAPKNNPRITESTTTLKDVTPNLVSKQLYTYDSYLNRTDVYEYDFGAGAVGPLVRRAHTGFVTTNDGANYASDTAIHIRNLPSEEWVSSDAAGTNKLARTTYEYDNYTADTNHAVMASRSDIAGLDASYNNPSYTKRGNVTAISRLLLPASTSITSYQQYDVAGNLVKGIDARGNATNFNYSDCYGSPDDEARSNTPPLELGTTSRSYAFVTSVTNALSQTVYAQFDYYLGKLINGEDANGVITKGLYDDLLDRATEVVTAENFSSLKTRSRFTYDDSARMITTESDQNTYDDRAMKTVSLYDGLGRTFETHRYEGSGYITTRQEFDGLGRVKRSYNPYRTTSDETYGYSEMSYDSLGRVTMVKTSDNAEVTTVYSGATTTVTDQAGKKRRSMTDALGRLIRVDEPDSAGNLDDTGSSPQPLQPTSYVYDALDDLAKVTQGGQTRYFAYDSLKRVIRARNPEQDLNTNLSPPLTDSVTGNSQWSIKYAYDENSNLVTRTDARNITTTYSYDVLNRVTSRTYSDPTPAVSYKYDGQALPTGAPGTSLFDRGFSTGRLVAVTYNGTGAGSYTGYDRLGRANVSVQQTEGQNYRFTYGYDRAGEMTSEGYPSGRMITMGYDSAGRLISVNGQKSVDPNKPYATAMTYGPQGALSSMTFGNNLLERTSFNSRLQPTIIKLGTSSNPVSVIQLDYTYGVLAGGTPDATKNNGNIQSQKVTVGSDSIKQTYLYDSLNRLQTAAEAFNQTAKWMQSYGYDRYGNRSSLSNSGVDGALLPTSSTPSVDVATNRINQTGFVYDAAGDLKQEATGNTHDYDAENRQTKFNNGAVTYTYDGDGQRVKKVVIGSTTTTTLFVYNVLGQLIAEYTDPTSSTSSGTSYLTTDHLGSTRVVTRAAGTVRARYDYLPFGEEIASAVANRSSVPGYGANDGTRQKFTQKERDSESGLDYFLARYYSSAQGRFTSSDPLLSSGVPDDPQTWNRYSYVLNNPLKYIDPFGLFVWGTSLGGSAADGDVSRTIREKREQIRGAIRGGNEALNSGRLDSTQKANLERALNAYGAEGTDNGVTVAVGAVTDGAAAETTSQQPYVLLGEKAQDAKANVLVTFRQGGSVDAETFAHEGSHVADRQELVGAFVKAAITNQNPQADWLYLPENITKRQTESRAYRVSAAVAQGLGNDFSPGGYDVSRTSWRAVDRSTNMQRGIKQLLTNSRLYREELNNRLIMPPRR